MYKWSSGCHTEALLQPNWLGYVPKLLHSSETEIQVEETLKRLSSEQRQNTGSLGPGLIIWIMVVSTSVAVVFNIMVNSPHFVIKERSTVC